MRQALTPPPGRRAFILPFVLVLITVLATLGTWYLFSTVQSKNIFYVFYRDDLARLVAESAIAEYRATIHDRVKNNQALANLIANPASNNRGVPFSLADLPSTSAMANSLLGGSGRCELDGTVTVRHVDYDLIEEIGGTRKRSTFDREYQGTVRFQFRLGLGPSDKRRFSSFLYEFDVKRACLRSLPSQRVNRGYTTNALNDYVLYIRDAYQEFQDINVKGKSLNNDDRTLIIDHTNSGKRGKIFLGCGRENDPDKTQKYVFVNVNEKMDWLLPDNPPDLVIPWTTLKQADHMPKFTQELEAKIQEAEQQAQGQVNFTPEKVKAIISVEHKPLVGTQGWWQNLVARVKALFDRFFRIREGTTIGNKEKPIHLLGPQDNDQSMCNLIEGNVRQRFWQTATFRMDFSEITDNAQVNQAITQQVGDKFNIDVQYYSDSELNMLQNSASISDSTKEIYKVIRFYENRDKTLLMSMPNPLYPFKPKPAYADRNLPGVYPDPPLVGRTIGGTTVDFTNFLPFAPFLVRSYRFVNSQELYNSPFYDADTNTLTLNGIVMIENEAEGLTIKQDLKYSGRGVLLSYGDIRIEGNFTKADPAADGPCMLYTYRGNIIANVKAPGKIEASLIALNYRYNPTGGGGLSIVNFSGRKAQVKGNLLADRLQLGTMATGVENSLTYDSETLNGDLLYCTTFGGRLRTARMTFDDPGARP
ncbi:MAG: hypothetical protein GX442_14700 [Candidatus Riflebacteria bacterium]|nr:hypothetical protein [Candidatus Riflebacteria bacterium]